jgi:hypothetical protein
MFDLPLALLYNENTCDGIWTTILTMLFPSSKNFLLTPMRRMADSPLVMELQTMSTTSTPQLHTVLVIDIRKTRHCQWPAGISRPPAVIQYIRNVVVRRSPANFTLNKPVFEVPLKLDSDGTNLRRC